MLKRIMSSEGSASKDVSLHRLVRERVSRRRGRRRGIVPALVQVKRLREEADILYSRTKLKRLAFNHDAQARDAANRRFAHIEDVGAWTGPRVWSGKGNSTAPNFFAWNYLAQAGDLNEEWIRSQFDTITFGGSPWDGMLGLKGFDRPYDRPCPWSSEDFTVFREFLGIPPWTALDPLALEGYEGRVGIKLSANPGPTLKRLGVQDKGEATMGCMAILRALRAGEINAADLPPFDYSMGGRGKPQSLERIYSKQSELRACGRAVWMADALETFACWMFTMPLNELFKDVSGPIDIGWDRHSEDSRGFFSHMFETASLCISIDWDAFDSTVEPEAIRMAFCFIRSLFPSLDRWQSELLDAIEISFIHTRIVCPDGRVRQKHGGVPSGSGFTAIVDSLVNAYVMMKFFEGHIPDPNTRIEVCRLSSRFMGDDNIHFFTLWDRVDEKWLLGRRGRKRRMAVGAGLLKSLDRYARSQWGMEVSVRKSKVTADSHVRYAFPKYLHGVFDHSRYLQRLELEKRGLVSLPPGERAFYRKTEREALAIRGARVKRWHYSFTDAATYCSSYFLEDGTPIRPKPDIMSRLASPSSSVQTVEQWRGLLIQYLMEYWSNESARGELISMWLDSFYAEREGILTASDAEQATLRIMSGELPPLRRALAEMGYNKPVDNGLKIRGFWIAQADWEPQLSDLRFHWLRPHIKALYKFMSKLQGGSGLSTAELGMYRPIFLGTVRGRNMLLPQRRREQLEYLCADWHLLVGLQLQVGNAYRPSPWYDDLRLSVVLGQYRGRPPDPSTDRAVRLTGQLLYPSLRTKRYSPTCLEFWMGK